ncbi:hypothetical protein MGYG_08998 [Nannizzia gypsea CBS 118893]|uniref:Uncharacterized protein n=1 Tax=Arthroderma gypseum (strain ATCC MYA-4604 / CBS 118893) TaxID=535722 RepID=E4UP64_ARTGP|nr:hypothetical protein MGYG_08998 [Nannizzia gypsea CBS 118893]EFQ99790.1 hypothetical protein MGYG_08998 [Nannizzia gypsea CBS 118893]
MSSKPPPRLPSNYYWAMNCLHPDHRHYIWRRNVLGMQMIRRRLWPGSLATVLWLRRVSIRTTCKQEPSWGISSALAQSMEDPGLNFVFLLALPPCFGREDGQEAHT